MKPYCYRVNKVELEAGAIREIVAGAYKGKFAIHIIPGGLEDPDSIPIIVQREIPWSERHRSNVLVSTVVMVGFPDRTEEYEVACDFDTVDGHCLYVSLISSVPRD